MKSKIYQKISRLGFISSIVTLITCIGCNTTKNIPENDALYTGASINIISSQASSKENKVIKESLQGLTRPKPNSRLFGIPFKLGIYNMAGKGNKGLNKILKNWGEPPVLLSQLNLENNVSILTNSLENRGFFHASVVGDTVVEGKKASAKYDVKTREQYTINDIFFPDDSGRIYNEIRQSASNSLLQKGKTFNLEVIKGERLRIDAVLKEKGFFYFNPEHLLILVDSTIGNDQVNLYVEFKADVPLAARERYFINDVYIYSDYSLNEAANDTLLGDTVSYRGYNLIARKHAFKPQVFDRIMMFSPQDIYNRTDHNTTLARLINLGTFKFVKNRFELLKDSTALNAYYYLTPQPKKSLSVELGGLIKSNNATGSEISLKWRNRNTFKGAELLTVSTYFGTEVQFSSQNSGVNITRYGAEANLTVPRFVLPIFRFNTSGSFVPRTNFQLGYDVLQRSQQYTLNSFRAQFGYVWKENVRTEHRLNPIAVTFVQPLNVTREYDSTIQFRPILQRAIEKQFILGSNYNFNYNQLVDKPKNASGMYFNGIVDLSGNIAGLIKRGNVSRGDTAKIFNLPFSQYVKTEADFRYYQRIGLKTQLANRVIFGLGLPYGNSDALPFSKQFFIGGNNSLRGFRSRSVGPGTDTAGGNFNSAGGKVNQIFADKTGDIKLEFNTELRIPLNNIFSTAVFADAGNVWLYNRDTRQPGGKFSKEFLKELAVDAGVGLRIDITILLLRLDLAVPLRKPFLPEGQRWVIKDLRFGDVVYNLAIGYPF